MHIPIQKKKLDGNNAQSPNAQQTIATALIKLVNYLHSSPDGQSSCCHPVSALLLIIVLIHPCIPLAPKAITLCKPHPAACLSLVNGNTQHAVKLRGPCLMLPRRSLLYLSPFHT